MDAPAGRQRFLADAPTGLPSTERDGIVPMDSASVCVGTRRGADSQERMLRIRDRARTVFGLDAVKLILIRTTLDLTLGLCQRLAAMQRLRLVAALRGRQTEADGPPSAVRVHWQGQYVEGVGAEPQPAVVTVTATGLEIRTVAGATRWWPFHQVRRTPDADGAVRLQRHVTAPEALVVPDPAFLQAIRTAGPRAVRRRVLRPGRRGMRV